MARHYFRMAFLPALCLIFAGRTALAQPFFMGSAITYQGQLQDGAAPAAGPVDLVFRLYDAPTGGSQVSRPVAVSPAPSPSASAYQVG